MKRVYYLIVAVFMMLPLRAQNAPGDTINRLAQDFVTASVCIVDPTDWHDDFLGVSGHAFIRLQCPTFGRDICFSYESEDAQEDMGKFLRGQLSMGMFRVATSEYIKAFQRWKAAIHEYTLNIPPAAKLRLWQIMDERVEEGHDLQLDLMRRGCTQTLVEYVTLALDTMAIDYGAWPEEYNMTRREMMSERMAAYPWLRILLADMFLNGGFNENVRNDEKIIYPTQMRDMWLQAKVDGEPLLTYKEDLVKAPLRIPAETTFTPLLCAVILLVVTLVARLLSWRFNLPIQWYSIALLSCQCAVGLLLCWLVAVSNLPGSKGAHLLLLYNPLPLLLWRWRTRWASWYVCALLIWGLAMMLHPHFYVESAHLVVALAVCVLIVQKISFRR